MQSSSNLYTLKQPASDCVTPAGVLAIHGSASNGKLWRPLQSALLGRRVVTAPDLDGYSPHPRQVGRKDRLDQLGAILRAQAAPMDIVAHSFGGAIALKLANVFPDHVGSVSIYDPVVPVRTDDGGSGLPTDLRSRLHKIDIADARALMQFFFEYWGSAEAWQALPEDKRQRLLQYHAAFLRDLSELMSGKWTVLNSRYKCPIHVFRGTASKTATWQSCEHIAATFAQARWIEISGLDHLAPITNPGPVNAALLDCLGEEAAESATPLTSQTKSAA